jgi:hypothetical protein
VVVALVEELELVELLGVDRELDELLEELELDGKVDDETDEPLEE